MWLRVKWLEDKPVVCKTLEFQGVVVWIPKKKRALFPRGTCEAHGGLDDKIDVSSQPFNQNLKFRRSQEDAKMGHWHLMLVHRVIAIGKTFSTTVVKNDLMTEEVQIYPGLVGSTQLTSE